MKELSSETVKQIQGLSAEYRESKEQLMEILLKIQKLTSNAFEPQVMDVVSHATGIPISKLYDYSTFYSMFSTVPRGKYIVRMCKSAPCHICGAKEVADAICDFLEIKAGETTADHLFTVEFCECIGLCEKSPSVMINDEPYSNLSPEKIRNILSQYKKGVGV